MTAIEEYIKKEGIVQLSSAVFTTHDSPNGKFHYPANATVISYCEYQGVVHGVSAEEYAKDLLGFITAPAKRIIGECMVCSKFLIEGEDENHVCPEDKIQEHKRSQEVWAKISEKINES